jgi:NADH pyrophosphatase NudC (nudix superfamily)
VVAHDMNIEQCPLSEVYLKYMTFMSWPFPYLHMIGFHYTGRQEYFCDGTW